MARKPNDATMFEWITSKSATVKVGREKKLHYHLQWGIFGGKPIYKIKN